MINAIIQGENDAQTLSELARGTDAAGNYRNCKQLWKVGSNLITRCCFSGSSPICSFWNPPCEPLLKEIEAQMEPYQEVVEFLMTHPGVLAVAAMGFVSEVGIDLSRFPSAKHAGLPGLACVQAITEVAGKRKHGKSTKGNTYLRALLAEIVWGISHTKDNYLSAQYHRLARRIGKTKTIVAVSHTVAVNFYHMITKRIPYQELGANYFDTFDRERLTKHTVKRLEALGYEVTLTQKEVGV